MKISRIKICNKCGSSEFYSSVKYDKCVSCSKAHSAIYRVKYREKTIELTRKWRKKSQEKIKAYQDANREKIRVRVRERSKNNRENINADARKRYAENLYAYRNYAAKWRRAHPEEYRRIQQNREAKKRLNGGRLSKGIQAKLYKLQKGLCPCCRKPLGDNYELDHNMPIALGGENKDWNVQLLRQECNRKKRAKHPIDYMQERGFLL